MIIKNKYKKDFLKLVILRIDFEKIADFDDKKFDSFKKEYPNKKTEPKTEFLTVLSKGGQSISQRSFDIYRYSDDLKNCFCIGESFCFFELKSHIGYEGMKKQFLEAFEILKQEFSLEIIKRIGLRYVNDIKISGVNNFNQYISSHLLSNSKFYNNINKFCRREKLNIREKSLCLGRISFKNGDINTNFLFGNDNNNYPAAIIDENFLLDYDSFCTNVHKDDLINRLDKIHEEVNFLFEQSITTSLRNIMNEK